MMLESGIRQVAAKLNQPRKVKPMAKKVKAPKVPPLPKEKPAKKLKPKTFVLHTRVAPEVASRVKALAKANKVTVSRLLAELCRKL